METNYRDTICIYHSKDADGWSCAALFKLFVPGAEYMGWDYSEDPEHLIDYLRSGAYTKIYMADVSLPVEYMDKIPDIAQFIFIDHHIGVLRDMFPDADYQPGDVYKHVGDGVGVFIDTNYAACENVWRHFSSDPVPIAILLLGKYDSWRNDSLETGYNGLSYSFEDAVAFNRSMYLEDDAVDKIYRLVIPGIDSFKNKVISEQLNTGYTVLKFQQNQYESDMRNGAFDCDIIIEGKKIAAGIACMCAFSGFGSKSFDSVYNPEVHEVMIPFTMLNTGKWVMTFYSTHDHIDCSEIAKKLGGGGHKGAAGCNIDYSPIETILKPRINFKPED